MYVKSHLLAHTTPYTQERTLLKTHTCTLTAPSRCHSLSSWPLLSVLEVAIKIKFCFKHEIIIYIGKYYQKHLLSVLNTKVYVCVCVCLLSRQTKTHVFSVTGTIKVNCMWMPHTHMWMPHTCVCGASTYNILFSSIYDLPLFIFYF